MACRRGLSSTPLKVWGSETLWDSGERKLTNKNYRYCNGLESVQALVECEWVGEWVSGEWVSGEWVSGWVSEWWVSGDKFIGVCTEASRAMGAEAADFFFYWRYSEALADERVWHVPGGFTISRKTFDWNRSKIAMLEFEVMPQSWMPYVQMGLSIAL
jgi:hypothetical protein